MVSTRRTIMTETMPRVSRDRTILQLDLRRAPGTIWLSSPHSEVPLHPETCGMFAFDYGQRHEQYTVLYRGLRYVPARTKEYYIHITKSSCWLTGIQTEAEAAPARKFSPEMEFMKRLISVRGWLWWWGFERHVHLADIVIWPCMYVCICYISGFPRPSANAHCVTCYELRKDTICNNSLGSCWPELFFNAKCAYSTAWIIVCNKWCSTANDVSPPRPTIPSYR